LRTRDVGRLIVPHISQDDFVNEVALMPNQRPAIPAALERGLMIEAGYRCAICKETSSLQIEHIVEWAEVQEHEFSNMIVLCATCHGRKKDTSDPRHINRASLKQIKQKLMMLNGRYSDLERRIIECFQEKLAADPQFALPILFPEQLYLLVKYLIDDGIIDATTDPGITTVTRGISVAYQRDTLRLTLTPAGRQFILGLPA
jgi:HNH endonuclease